MKLGKKDCLNTTLMQPSDKFTSRSSQMGLTVQYIAQHWAFGMMTQSEKATDALLFWTVANTFPSSPNLSGISSIMFLL